MGTVIHSPFLQALGYAIINSLWQFALLWLLYFAVNTVFRLSSHQKYSTGIVLQLAGFTWFIGSLLFYYRESLVLAQSVINQPLTFSTLNADSDASLKEQFFRFVLHSERFFPYLSIAYLALLFILALRWVYAYRYTQQVRTRGIIRMEDSWQLFVEKISLQLGISRKVRIFLSDVVKTPLTVGFLKPLILVPVATVNYLNTQQMEAVILHELAHIKRLDYLFNLFLALVEAGLFFNPFMQLINQQIKKERENCCDDWVLKYDYCAASYARALLQIASNHSRSPLLALNATDGNRLLINRIKRIIEKKEKSFFNYKHQLLALFVMTVVLSMLSFLSPGKKRQASTFTVRQNVVFEPMVAKVNNPLFNPVFFLASSSKTPERQRVGALKVVRTGSATAGLAGSFQERKFAASHPSLTEIDVDPMIDQTSATEEVIPVAPEDNNEALRKLSEDIKENKLNAQLVEVSKQTQLAVIRLERIQTEFSSGKNVTLEKVRIKLRKALAELKSSRKQGESDRRSAALATIRTRKATEQKGINLRGLQNNELILLEEQIDNVLDSLNHVTFYTAAMNDNTNLAIQFPAVVYQLKPEPRAQSFSYEYPSKPAVRVIKAPVFGWGQDKSKTKEKVIVVTGDEDVIDKVAPPPPPPGIKIRVHRIRI